MTTDEKRLADLLAIMRDEARPGAERTAAAIEALPMVHRMPEPLRADAARACLGFVNAERDRTSKRR